MIVAIDGPAGSGKSTTARRVAERMGWLYLDTGAMYRAAALAFIEAGRPITLENAHELLPELAIDLMIRGGATCVMLDGSDVTDRVRAPEVGEAASRVSALAPVRERMVAEQRRVARTVEPRGVIVEGRDIGTVVFPEAELKIFLIASVEERVRRRHAELVARGEDVSADEVGREIVQRDERDERRQIAPLRRATDALTIDTTHLSLDEQVQAVVGLIKVRQREHVTG